MAATALLVMDLQQRMATRVRDDDYLPRLAGAVGAARAAGVPVIHVVVGFRVGHPEANPRNKVFGALPADSFTSTDTEAAIHPDLAPEPGEPVVTKKRVSAFAGSDLEMILRSGGFDHLVLSGISTSGVVLATLSQAADLDYRLTVLADGCYDPEPDTHEFLTRRIFPKRGEVVTADDWRRGLPTAR